VADRDRQDAALVEQNLERVSRLLLRVLKRATV
jgi:hypothetical protein